MVYPKTVHLITDISEVQNNSEKLNSFCKLMSKINEIENVYLTVTRAEDRTDFIDTTAYPYIVKYVPENGLEELMTREFATLPAPDLIIKTGAPRLVNVLIWHTAYSEYYFTEKPLKKLNMDRLEKILQNFQSHHRTFGM